MVPEHFFQFFGYVNFAVVPLIAALFMSGITLMGSGSVEIEIIHLLLPVLIVAWCIKTILEKQSFLEQVKEPLLELGPLPYFMGFITVSFLWSKGLNAALFEYVRTMFGFLLLFLIHSYLR